MSYIHILTFLMTHDLTELKEFWRVEYLKSDKFKWRKLISRLIRNRMNPDNFMFWWRLASEMFFRGNTKQVRRAKKIQNKLILKYHVEIQLGAKIGLGMIIVHYSSINITSLSVIGKNFTCHQNVTIGLSKNPCLIKIGDNVTVGCNSVVLGDEISIGDNVYIGALTFVNKDIPANRTVITKKENEISIRNNN